ncbi:hypothetical protein RRG08_055621 [Elysia crispata]|uniref:Uncharacterized protein n=1 Tax=Elysia crispata TaxID=231223 RepID=A0AAE1E6A1_9GAST|nr:hypothetical protein RRG08_055621 [Elysia crispata]
MMLLLRLLCLECTSLYIDLLLRFLYLECTSPYIDLLLRFLYLECTSPYFDVTPPCLQVYLGLNKLILLLLCYLNLVIHLTQDSALFLIVNACCIICHRSPDNSVSTCKAGVDRCDDVSGILIHGDVSASTSARE